MLIVNAFGFYSDFSGSGIPADFPTALTSSVIMYFDASNYESGSNRWVDRVSSYALDVSNLTHSGSYFYFSQSPASYAYPLGGFTAPTGSQGTFVVHHRNSNTSSGSRAIGYNTDTLQGSIAHFGSGSSNISLRRSFINVLSPQGAELKYVPTFRFCTIATGSFDDSASTTSLPRSVDGPYYSTFMTEAVKIMSATAWTGSTQVTFWSDQSDQSGSVGTSNTYFTGVPSGSFLYLGTTVNQETGAINSGSTVDTGPITGSIGDVLYFDRYLDNSELMLLRDYLLA